MPETRVMLQAKSGGSASRDLLQTKFGLPTEVTNIFSWDAAFKSTLSVDPSIELVSTHPVQSAIAASHISFMLTPK
jgi:hypothetical protein